MRSSGVTLEEIRRLFKALEESKSNNSMQILIDNEMCKQFQDIIETICSSKDKKDKEIERLNTEIMDLKEQIVSAIRCNNLGKEQATLVEEQAKIYEQEITIIKEKRLKEENIRLNNIINKIKKLVNECKIEGTDNDGESDYYYDYVYVRDLDEY